MKPQAKKAWLLSIEKFYGKILLFVLNRRYVFISVALLTLAGFIAAAKKTLKIQMFPQSNIETFYIKVEAPKDYSLDRTEAIIKNIEKTVASLPKKELLSYTSRTGHHSTSKTKNYGDHENWGIVNVFLTPDSERTRSAGQIITGLKKKLKKSKGVNIIVDKKKVGAIRGKAIAMHFSSNDNAVLLKAEKKALNFLKKMKPMGLSDIDSTRKEGKDEIVVDIDHRKMASLGISTEDVARVLKIAYDGEIVTSVQTLKEKLDYRLLLNEKSRRKEKIIKELRIKNTSGSLIRLGEFISFHEQPSDLEISHRNGLRNITITAAVKPKTITSLEAAKYISKNLIENWDIPENLEIEVGGETQKTKEIMKDVGMAVIAAVIFIFFVLAMSLNSWLQPVIIMSVIPFNIIGIIFALITHGQNVSMFVMLAAIGLTGVVVNDSIVMVNVLNKNLKSGKDTEDKKNFPSAIAEHSKTRLRPILLTTITTLSGLVPMAYGLGGYEKMISPLSLAFAWGLLFATMITLFLVPALYMITDDLQSRKADR